MKKLELMVVKLVILKISTKDVIPVSILENKKNISNVPNVKLMLTD